MSGYDFATSISSANPAASRAGEGDVTVIGGGKVGGWVVALIAALVFGVGLMIWILLRRKRKKK